MKSPFFSAVYMAARPLSTRWLPGVECRTCFAGRQEGIFFRGWPSVATSLRRSRLKKAIREKCRYFRRNIFRGLGNVFRFTRLFGSPQVGYMIRGLSKSKKSSIKAVFVHPNRKNAHFDFLFAAGAIGRRRPLRTKLPGESRTGSLLYPLPHRGNFGTGKSCDHTGLYAI